MSAAALALLTVAEPMAPAAHGQPDPTPNPALPDETCGLRVVVVVDTSSSIIDAGAENPDIVRSAATTFLQALRASPSTATIVSFRRNAVTELPASSLDDPAGFRQAQQAIDGLQFDDSGFGPTAGTNWQAALRAAQRAPQPPGDPLDLVIFITDGNPNRYGTDLDRLPGGGGNDFDPAALDAGVAESSILRGQGTRVVAVGVGDVREEALQAVSGPVLGQDWFTGDFAALTATLGRVGTALCGSRVVAQAEVDGAPLAGLRFTLAGGGEPATRRTGPDGSVVLRPSIAEGDRARLTLSAPATTAGSELAGIECSRNDEPIDAVTRLGVASASFDAGEGEVADCVFSYERVPGSPGSGSSPRSQDEPIGAAARLLDDLSVTGAQITDECRRDRDNRNGFGRTWNWVLRNDLENCINDAFMRDVAERLAGLDPGRFPLPGPIPEGSRRQPPPQEILGTSGWKPALVDRDGQPIDAARSPARHFVGWLAAAYFHPRTANTALSCSEYETDDIPEATGQDLRSGRIAVDLGIKVRRGDLSLDELLVRIEQEISDPDNPGQADIVDEPSPASVPAILRVGC